MVFKSVVTVALLVAGSLQDGPRVSARISATSVGVGEAVVLSIVVENASADAQIDAPRLPGGLELVGTQDFTEMQYSIPGGRQLTRRREFALQTSRPGRFRIPPVVVSIDNKAYRTNAVEVVVTGSAQPRSIESSDEAWLRAAMRPETVYVGRQSTLTVTAGFSEDVRMRLTRPPVFDTPSPTGFWVQDVPGGVASRLQSVNDRIVETQTLQRAYFPLTAGSYALAPARAIIDVREGFLFAPETREIRSGSPKLFVLPLPERGRPRDFRGAVGWYSIKASVQPDTVAIGEAAQLTIELTGTGNIKATPPPTLAAIAGVEQFTPTEDASVSFDGAVVGGSKQFKWVIIAQRAGAIELPAARFSFFDPRLRSYRTIATEPLTLFATPGPAGVDSAVSGTALRAIRATPRRASLQFVRTHWFLLLQLVPLLLLAALLLARRQRARKSDETILSEELARIGGAQLPFPAFLRDLEGVIRSAVALRARDTSLRTAQVRVVGPRMQAAGVAESTATRTVALIERIETQRFAPAAVESVERAALLAEASALVQLLLQREPAGGARASVLALALLLLQGQPQAGNFSQGVELYRSGRFDEAAASFAAAVRTQPHDVAAWSNLGNAHFRSGQRGRAVWAWSKAAREAPRDRDIVANLQAAGAMEVLRTRPPLSVRPVEWYLLAALAWWLACAAVAYAVVRRRREWLWWALGGVAGAIVAVVVGVLAARKQYAVALDDETRLYGDPTIHSPVVRTVQAGAGLDVVEVRGDWLRVRTLTQAEGWVEADAAGLL